MKKAVLVILSILLIAIIVLGARGIYSNIKLEAEMRLYPLPDEYAGIIKTYSEQNAIPIELLYAVINTESSFDPNARSHAGAMGIMQITEDTFNWLQFKTGGQDPISALYDPETSIRLGTTLLSYLYNEFGNWDTALAAYNAGLNRVKGWLKDPEYSENGVLTVIPIEETDNYIKKINKAKEKYKELYFTNTSTE